MLSPEIHRGQQTSREHVQGGKMNSNKSREEGAHLLRPSASTTSSSAELLPVQLQADPRAQQTTHHILL